MWFAVSIPLVPLLEDRALPSENRGANESDYEEGEKIKLETTFDQMSKFPVLDKIPLIRCLAFVQ